MDWSYIAGFFDGEGGFHLELAQDNRRKKLSIQPKVLISFTSTHGETLDSIMDYLKSKGITAHNYHIIRKKNYGNIKRKPYYTIRIIDIKAIRMFVTSIERYLIAKKQSCDVFKQGLVFWEIAHINKTNVQWTKSQLMEFEGIMKKLEPFLTKRKPKKTINWTQMNE